MSTPERDPRVNPIRNDVLTKTGRKNFQRRVVIGTSDERVRFHKWEDEEMVCHCMTRLKVWRKWAATAEVVRRGDEG